MYVCISPQKNITLRKQMNRYKEATAIEKYRNKDIEKR